MHYLISGGSGFIGQALVADLLCDGHAVTVLTRSPARAASRLPQSVAVLDDLAALAGVDAVVNLAGENLGAARWNTRRKQAFVQSRVDATRRLIAWLRQLAGPPPMLVSASAIGWYGARGDEVLDETAAPGSDFAAHLCQAWETEAQQAEALGVRVCRVRIGVVLGSGGGALAQMLPAFKLGAGGPMGDGRQWMSWVHRDDLIALIRWLSVTANVSGAYNGTAPQPATNAGFAKTLGRVLGRPALLPMPGFALRVLIGEMAEILLSGQRVLPQRALDAGFAFRFPALEGALRDVLRRQC